MLLGTAYLARHTKVRTSEKELKMQDKKKPKKRVQSKKLQGKKVENSDKLSEIKPNKTLKERWKVANSDAKGLVQASAGHDCC